MPAEFHLPVENWLKFLSTQAGRDKVYRFVQYFSRFLAFHLRKRNNLAGAVLLAQRLTKLSLAVGAGRKLFRMGKPLDFLQSALKALSGPDEIVKWGSVLKCTGYGGWLVLDMLQWLQGAGVIELGKESMAWVNKQAPRLWLLGILSNLMVNLHRIQVNFQQRQFQLLTEPLSVTKVLDKEMRKLTKDALQDLIDLVIPLSLTGWVEASPGTVGLAGSITSLMGAVSLYPPSS